MKRVGELKKIYLLPNLVTTLCLFSGCFSIMQSLNGRFVLAAWAVFGAFIFDSLDGRLARLTGSESPFGVQYDSLSDLVSFGVAPSILVYSWALQPFGRLAIAVAFMFMACAALRLARYNVQINKIEKASFQGLPVPAAAGFLITFVLFYEHLEITNAMNRYIVLLGAPLLAVLMVSNVRYPSFKAVDFKSRSSFYYLVGGVAFLVLIILEPAVMLFVCQTAYILYGVFAYAIFHQRLIVAKTAREQATHLNKKNSGRVKILEMSREAQDKHE